MILKTIIIEDEPIAQEKLLKYIEKIDFIDNLAVFESPVESINFLHNHVVNLIFLDIKTPEMNGLDFLNSLVKMPKVIITSAYSEYAIEGYKYNVSYYLLKPFDFSKFLKAVNKVFNEIQSHNKNKLLFLKTGNYYQTIDISEIMYIKSEKDYLNIILEDKNILTLDTFSSISEKLDMKNFVRVHRSYMVSLSKIQKVEKDRIYIGNEVIPISNTYKEKFYQLIN